MILTQEELDKAIKTSPNRRHTIGGKDTFVITGSAHVEATSAVSITAHDKTTIRGKSPFVTVTVRVLEQTKTPYILIELRRVNRNGLNDPPSFPAEDALRSNYPIRLLEYEDVILIEVRSPDRDTDDILMSLDFKKGTRTPIPSSGPTSFTDSTNP